MSVSALQSENALSEILAQELKDKILRQGHITFHDWMESALYHPSLGYYNRRKQRWGKDGDYRTSPERSELFAATFARYFASLYDTLGRPPKQTLVEVGAGDGQFAFGVLQTLEAEFSDLYHAARYLIDEKSEDGQQRISAKLIDYIERYRFVELALSEPIESGILFSNELLDAFPVHRVTSRSGELKELYVGLTHEGQFKWQHGTLSSEELKRYCEEYLPPLQEGQIVEVNLNVDGWYQTLNQKLKSGYVITVDYGADAAELYGLPERRHGTLRAFRNHRFVDDVFEMPGDCDLTTTVDWTYIQKVGGEHGFQTIELTQLDRFLISNGALEELESQLASAVNDADRSRLTTAAREMILPGGMASSFQVLVQKR